MTRDRATEQWVVANLFARKIVRFEGIRCNVLAAAEPWPLGTSNIFYEAAKV